MNKAGKNKQSQLKYMCAKKNIRTEKRYIRTEKDILEPKKKYRNLRKILLISYWLGEATGSCFPVPTHAFDSELLEEWSDSQKRREDKVVRMGGSVKFQINQPVYQLFSFYFILSFLILYILQLLFVILYILQLLFFLL